MKRALQLTLALSAILWLSATALAQTPANRKITTTFYNAEGQTVDSADAFARIYKRESTRTPGQAEVTITYYTAKGNVVLDGRTIDDGAVWDWTYTLTLPNGHKLKGRFKKGLLQPELSGWNKTRSSRHEGKWVATGKGQDPFARKATLESPFPIPIAPSGEWVGLTMELTERKLYEVSTTYYNAQGKPADSAGAFVRLFKRESIKHPGRAQVLIFYATAKGQVALSGNTERGIWQRGYWLTLPDGRKIRGDIEAGRIQQAVEGHSEDKNTHYTGHWVPTGSGENPLDREITLGEVFPLPIAPSGEWVGLTLTVTEQKSEEITFDDEPRGADDNGIFQIVEDMPEPEGGMPAFYTFVAENINYPSQAKRLGIEGKVYVQFIVGKDGSISDTKVLKGIGAGCDEEAIRIISEMPNWKPGRQRGRPVKVRMQLPITFRL